MPTIAISSGTTSASDTPSPLTLMGTVSPGAVVTILDRGLAVGTAVVDASGAWTFSGPIPSAQDHLLSARAAAADGTTADTLQLYAVGRTPLFTGVGTTFAVSDAGIDVTSVKTVFLSGPTTTVNHYTAGGTLQTQTTTYAANHMINDSIEVKTAPDANGITTNSIQTPDGIFYGISPNIKKNYYDAAFHILKQEVYDPAGKLLTVETAPDATGHSTLTDYSVANQIIIASFDGAQKSYANHYDLAMNILSQDLFYASNSIKSSTTAPDANGHLTAIEFDEARSAIATVDYTSANTTLNALHRVGPNQYTQSANYQIYTGDGILPIGFSTGDISLGDTFTFTSAYTTPSHQTILGFDPEDHVVLNGYDPTHFVAQEDGTNVTLTLSDQSVVLFDHVAHVADLHLVWA